MSIKLTVVDVDRCAEKLYRRWPGLWADDYGPTPYEVAIAVLAEAGIDGVEGLQE